MFPPTPVIYTMIPPFFLLTTLLPPTFAQNNPPAVARPNNLSGLLKPTFSLTQGIADPNDNPYANQSPIFQNYWPAFIVAGVLCFCTLFWIFRCKLFRSARHPVSHFRTPSADRSDPDIEPTANTHAVSNTVANSNTNDITSVHSESASPAATFDLTLPRRRREPGLNERGEAPPPYLPGQVRKSGDEMEMTVGLGMPPHYDGVTDREQHEEETRATRAENANDGENAESRFWVSGVPTIRIVEVDREGEDSEGEDSEEGPGTRRSGRGEPVGLAW